MSSASDFVYVPRKKAKVAKKRPVKKTYMAKPKRSLGFAVRKELDRLAETKSATYVWNQLASGGLSSYASGSGVWGVSNITPFFPAFGYLSIPQGVGQGNRIGNSIRTHKLIYQGVVTPNQYDATWNPTPWPQELMFILFRRKDNGDTIMTQTGNLYQSGSTSLNPSGSLIDLVTPFNTDLYDVLYKRVFKIGPAENTGTGIQNTWMRIANNDFKFNVKFRMDLTKYIDKVIRFDDATNTAYGMSSYIHGAWYCMNATGTVATAAEKPCQLVSNLTLFYKDV